MKFTNKRVDYQKALQALRSPGLIHRIQDALTGLQGQGVYQEALRRGAKNNIGECIERIVEDYRTNPPYMVQIVGQEVLKMIEEFKGITLADDLDMVFGGLAD